MIEWRPLGTGARPVPSPVATPLVWAGAFGGALVLVAVLNTVVGTGHPGLALLALSLLAAVLGLCARFTAAPGTAVLCWLFLNGFAIPPAGTLTWAGPRDTTWLACLLTASLVGTSLARLAHARAAYRRLAPGRARHFGGRGGGPYAARPDGGRGDGPYGS
ncbi:hypothetical protein ACF1G5_15900 [Streptomyces coeruleorubidus]|uniref:hypothetical protein n=1 Tax=Streptomyces coeruleorubidus TaxID=116188 RepID=UPI0036FE1910